MIGNRVARNESHSSGVWGWKGTGTVGLVSYMLARLLMPFCSRGM